MKETDFAQYPTQFLSVYLPGQVGSKRNTQLAYKDSFSLFLKYCRDQENFSPEKLTVKRWTKNLSSAFYSGLKMNVTVKLPQETSGLLPSTHFLAF